MICILVFSSFYYKYNELEDEVVRDRSKNKPLKLLKIVRSASTGALGKWHEPLELYNGNYYPKWMKKPKYRERFKFSSTLFVPFTDTEHWYQFIKLRLINLIVIATTVFLTGFTLNILYTLLLNQLGIWSMSFIKEALLKNLN